MIKNENDRGDEIARSWHMKNVVVIRIVFGASGAVTTKFLRSILKAFELRSELSMLRNQLC